MFRILVAEESAIAREGLKQILAGSRDTVASGEASNAQDVFSQISRNSYDVVLLDTSIPGRSWLDIIKELKSQNAHLPVLVLSSHVDEDEAMRAFRAGASGYLTKACTPDELLTAVRKISNGGKYVSASLGERLASELVRGTEKPPHELLSDREYQVMGKLALGRTVSEIANEMSLSVKTISTYRSRVLEKLNLKNNVELAHYYTQFVDIRTVRCQKCGQENPQVVRYCAFCGAGIDVVSELPQSTAGPAPEVHKQRASFLRKPQWFAVTLAIIGVAAGVIVWRVQSAPPSGAVPDETGVPADGTSIALPKALELQHDDGQAEIYVHADSGGYLVHFSPPFVPFVINRVRMNGAALPSERPEFTLQLWDQDRKVIYSAAFPSTLFPAVDSPPQAMSAAMWVEIPVPGIEVQSDFYAHVLTGSRPLTGVFIGADDSAKNEHSGLTRPISEGGHEERQDWPVFGPGSRWATRDNVNWMIRVVGGYGGGSKPFSSGGQSSPASTAANSTSIATPARPLPSPDVFMKGMTFADWKSFDAPPGLYSSPMADKSLENLADTGANWISLVVSVTQETIASTKIFRTSSRTATDAELRRMVDLAHNLGMRVLLEPRVSVAADLALGQGNIGTAFVSEAQWQEWFASYREMIDHYAAFSQEAGVDALAIGAQLGGTIHREEDWRRIAANVRQRYQGPITYYPATGGTSGDDARIKWWDALDYISVFAFYPLTDKNSPTLVELEAAWTEKGYLTHLESLAKQFDRPVILRLMYLSTDGAAKKPNVPKGSAPVDIQEQADLYQAALEVLWGKPWLKGIFWWQWWVTQIGGPGDGSETPYGKSAEDVLKKFYSQPAPTVSNSVQKAPGQTEAAPTRPLPLPDAFMKGFNFTDWKNFDAAPAQWGLYRPPRADESLKNLAATGANWISLLVNVGQETIASTKVFRTQPRTAADAELKRMIDLAHGLGMRVALLVNVDLSNDPVHTQREIGIAFTSEAQWQEWFASYRELLNYYATFSQEAGVDMLVIGDALVGTTQRENDWRRVIKEARERFKGPITYAALYAQGSLSDGEDVRIKWWDAVDYIGWQPFYPLTDKNDPTVAELKAAWTEKGYLAAIENLSKQFNKPVIAIEFGYRSQDGANKWPLNWTSTAPVDLQEQADCYQAALEVLWGKPWLAGIFWWEWRAQAGLGGPKDTSAIPYGKPAEEVLKKFYLSP